MRLAGYKADDSGRPAKGSAGQSHLSGLRPYPKCDPGRAIRGALSAADGVRFGASDPPPGDRHLKAPLSPNVGMTVAPKAGGLVIGARSGAIRF